MPPPSKQTTNPIRAAKPTRNIFDAWNSSSTGHQRAVNRLSGSTSWRDSRTLKLRDQFSAGRSGGHRRIADTVGAGSEGFGTDGRLENGGWEIGAAGLRTGGQERIWESSGAGGGAEGKEEKVLLGKRKRDAEEEAVVKTGPSKRLGENGVIEERQRTSQESYEDALLKSDVTTSPEMPSWSSGQSEHKDDKRDGIDEQEDDQEEETRPYAPQIFAQLTIYVNGSTAPLISDHKLKQLLVSHGANVSIALGRRQVTHVILGRPNGASTNVGGAGAAGGGLASSKIQKEIARIGGKGVKFVSAEWVVESIKHGRRLPERDFECLRLAPRGVDSVSKMFDRQGLKGKEPG